MPANSTSWKGATFTHRTARELAQIAEERRNRVSASTKITPLKPIPQQHQAYAAKVTTQITAFASGGPTPGTGKVSLYYIDDDTGDLVEADTEIDVYNIVNAVVAVNKWGNVATDNWGKLWFIVEDCG